MQEIAEVAPLAGAWIEIAAYNDALRKMPVAPLAGAWIEISPNSPVSFGCASLPSRERGLKLP